jgi:hypothetical protein
MSNKEQLLGYLKQAKLDYELSIVISKELFFKRKRYTKLGTELGLTAYFTSKFNTPLIADVHLKEFKPKNIRKDLEDKALWFPVRTTEGFMSRLEIINLAINFYSNHDTVPMIPTGEFDYYLHHYVAYEQGLVPFDDVCEFFDLYLIDLDSFTEA